MPLNINGNKGIMRKMAKPQFRKKEDEYATSQFHYSAA